MLRLAANHLDGLQDFTGTNLGRHPFLRARGTTDRFGAVRPNVVREHANIGVQGGNR